MYLLFLPLSKMGRQRSKKPVRAVELPALPGDFRKASPWRPAEAPTVRRVAWWRAEKGGVVPRGLLCAAAMVLSAPGCESTTPLEVEDTALVTDGTSFRLDTATTRDNLWYSGKIPYSFTNRTGEKVYVTQDCLGSIRVGMQMQEDGEWEGVLGQVLVLCDGPPIVIEPDEVYETALNVTACMVGNCSPKIRLSPNASTPYRIVWFEALSSHDPNQNPHGELIPLEERVSNRFTLQVPR